MLERLRNFDVDRLDLDELVEISAFGRELRSEYEHLNLDVPEWVDLQLASLRREIRSRAADDLEKSLREKKSRLQSLMPAEEKRAALQKEIDALEARKQSVGA